MRVLPRSVLPVGVLLVGLAIQRPSAQTTTATLLDCYAAGEFDAVVATLTGHKDTDKILEDLRSHGQGWIDAGDPADKPRRELAAATFALEAARADAWTEWKFTQRNPMGPPAIYWKPPVQLIMWGDAIFRHDPLPRPIERWWQLGAVSIAERAEDYEFLISSGFAITGLAGPYAERANQWDECDYLTHLFARFPSETRFVLAQGIALDWLTWPDAQRGMARGIGAHEAQTVFEHLQHDEATGGEANMRLGALRLRRRDPAGAIKLFEQALRMTRDPYVTYLSYFFTGQAQERTAHTAEAEAAYRRALAVVPRAQSASLALAASLFQRDAQAEASTIVVTNLSGTAQPRDPWRTFADADDCFWPELIARLRAGIKP